MASLKKLKQIDNITRYKVLGYAREHEREQSIVIPIMIQYVIMMYYWIHEKFTNCGDALELNGNSKMVAPSKTSDKEGWNSVHGNNIINFNDKSITRYKWSIRYKRQQYSGCPTFGIASSKHWTGHKWRFFKPNLEDSKEGI